MLHFYSRPTWLALRLSAARRLQFCPSTCLLHLVVAAALAAAAAAAAAQVEQWREEGWLLISGVLPEPVVSEAAAAARRLFPDRCGPRLQRDTSRCCRPLMVSHICVSHHAASVCSRNRWLRLG